MSLTNDLRIDDMLACFCALCLPCLADGLPTALWHPVSYSLMYLLLIIHIATHTASKVAHTLSLAEYQDT